MYAQTVPHEYVRHIHPLPSIMDATGVNGLEGLNIGKFFSRAFHWEGIKKKIPRIVSGAATSLVAGGTGGSLLKGALTAAAGGVVAAIPERKKGSSLLKDIAVGGGLGLIPGTVIGAYRGVTSPHTRSITEVGVAGKATQAIQAKYFPKTITRATNPTIAPPAVRKVVATSHGIPPAPRTVPSQTTTGSILSEVLSTTGKVAAATLPLVATVALDQLLPRQEPGFMNTGQMLAGQPVSQYAGQPVNGMGLQELQMLTDEFPLGVPQDMSGLLAQQGVDGWGGGGGAMIPITDPQTGETTYIQPTFWQRYKWLILIGAGGLAGGMVLMKGFTGTRKRR